MPTKNRGSARLSTGEAPGQARLSEADLMANPSLQQKGEPTSPKAQETLWGLWKQVHGKRKNSNAKKPVREAPGKKDPYIVSIINQKGGTGKTTTTINLGAALAYLGFRTMVVDLDPQGHTTIGIGIDPDTILESMSEVMSIPRKSVADITMVTYIPNLDLAPTHIHLANVAEQIYTRIFREAILYQALQGLPYDFILIDCPPSLGVLTINALYASEFIIIPCQMSRYSLDGLADLLTTMASVKSLTSQDMFTEDLFRILLTMYDRRNRVTNQYVLEELKPYWNKVFQTIIMKNEALNQSQIAQKAVFDFDPHSSGSTDYQHLAVEFLQLYHHRTGVPVADKVLAISTIQNLKLEIELINI